MNSDNLKVICFKCGIPVDAEETIKFKVVAGFEELTVSKNIHICKSCIKQVPETYEYRSMNTHVLKFIN